MLCFLSGAPNHGIGALTSRDHKTIPVGSVVEIEPPKSAHDFYSSEAEGAVQSGIVIDLYTIATVEEQYVSLTRCQSVRNGTCRMRGCIFGLSVLSVLPNRTGGRLMRCATYSAHSSLPQDMYGRELALAIAV